MSDDEIQDLCREYALASIELHEASHEFIRHNRQSCRPPEVEERFARAGEAKVQAFRKIANQLRKVKQ